MVELLIASRAQLEALTVTGETPLHVAAEWGQLDKAELLLKAGAGLDIVDDNGETPLSIAGKLAPGWVRPMQALLSEYTAKGVLRPQQRSDNIDSAVASPAKRSDSTLDALCAKA